MQKLGGTPLTAAGGWLSSHELGRLSGTALWLPIEWRTVVNLSVGALAGAVFGLTQAWLDHRLKSRSDPALAKALPRPAGGEGPTDGRAAATGPADPADGPSDRESTLHKVFANRMALRFCVAAVVVLGLFMAVKDYCVVPFDARDWLAEQRLANLQDQQADGQQRVAATRPSAGAAAAAPVTESIRVSPSLTVADPSKTVYAPEFVDLERNQVYLPLWFPTDVRDYLRRLGTANSDGGVHAALALEPDHLFDMISTQATLQVGVTNCLFLLLDSLFVGLAAAALACTFDKMGSLIGLFLH